MEKQSNANYTVSSNAEHSYWVKKFWLSFLTYTKNFNTSDNLKKTIESELRKEIYDITMSLAHFAPTRSNYLRASAQKYFSNNSADFIQTYKSILAETEKDPKYLDFSPHQYSYNKEKFRTQFLIELLTETRELNPDIKHGSTEELRTLQTNLDKCDKLFEKRLKEDYIQLLIKLGDFLKKFNLTEEYSNTFNHILLTNSLNGLSYPTHKDESDCKCLDSIFTEECLNNLSLPKLIGLSGFWINKTSKAIISLNEMFFIINEFDLWDDVKSKKKYLSLDNGKVQAILTKTQELSKLEDGIFDIMESLQLDHPNLTQAEINTIFTELFNKKVSQQGPRYKKKFDKLLPESDNNLDHDLTEMHAMSNARYLLYRLKDICIFNLIMGSIDSYYSKNWGILPDSNTKFSNINFDIEGLNMPLRLHVYKKELMDFLNEFTGKPIAPLYQGSKDMIIRGIYIPTVILAPFFKKQKKFLVDELANPTKFDPDVLNFLRHIKFLRDDTKLPPSLKVANPNMSNAINLETGEELHISSKKKNR